MLFAIRTVVRRTGGDDSCVRIVFWLYHLSKFIGFFMLGLELVGGGRINSNPNIVGIVKAIEIDCYY